MEPLDFYNNHKNSVKNGALIFAALIIVFLLWQGCNVSRRLNALQTKKEEPATREMNPNISPVKVWKDDSGRTHLVLPANAAGAIVDRKADNSIFERIKPFIDSVSQALDIKSKQIEQLTTISTTVAYDSTPYGQRYVDSLKGVIRITNTYKNAYLSIVSRTGNILDSTDKGDFDYSYNAVINSTQYWKRNKLLGLPIGRKVSYIDLSSPDPKATINGVKKYTFVQSSPELGLHINARATYSTISQSFSTGLGMQFDFGRSYLNVAYIYNLRENKFLPVFTFAHDLIKF